MAYIRKSGAPVGEEVDDELDAEEVREGHVDLVKEQPNRF